MLNAPSSITNTSQPSKSLKSKEVNSTPPDSGVNKGKSFKKWPFNAKERDVYWHIAQSTPPPSNHTPGIYKLFATVFEGNSPPIPYLPQALSDFSTKVCLEDITGGVSVERCFAVRTLFILVEKFGTLAGDVGKPPHTKYNYLGSFLQVTATSLWRVQPWWPRHSNPHIFHCWNPHFLRVSEIYRLG